MKKFLLYFISFAALGFTTQKDSSFEIGERFVFRISYQFINAGYAVLEVKEATVNNKNVFHVVGNGYTTGLSRFFFKVEDTYESYIDKETGNPYRFIRKINEGGYTKNQEGFYKSNENKILVKDYKHNSESSFVVPKNTQDILSSFYYLRNYPNIDKMKVGEYASIDMFFDEKTTKFRLKFTGRESIKTKFGVVSTMIFKPIVESGRIFKEEESVTIWISDDGNKAPIRIKASLLVGSLKADLESYKNLKYPLNLKKNMRD
jgi:hypothetical protein